ncbi:MAG: branched-chain amino acid ABC transporter permease [Desulfatiglans sp.]|jgi:branched-chain amino acid transport system permease protein|nr:branched-chain amino acid ABC transporter permease [Thermodesulfobacteriota bacterium]MEE4353384.1 branched-chain amino acid ABC transporter permease [Desulfatiglans sp.]
MISLLSHVISGALVGLLYALIAMGFVIIYRSARVFNLAQGEIVVVGAFLIWSFAMHFELPMWLSLVLAFGGSFLLGLIIERTILRPLVGEELFALIMVTIGLMVFLRGLSLVIWGAEVHFIPPVFSMKGVKLGPFMLDRGLVAGAVLTVVAAAFFSWFFNRTRMGMEMTAVAEDHQIALSLGLNVKKSIAIAWALSGVLCTLAAVVFLSGKGMTFLVGDIGLAALPVALLAGLESIGGLVLAGLLIGIAMGVAEHFLDPIFQGGVAAIFPFAVMIVILLIRPSGLFGWKTIERI